MRRWFLVFAALSFLGAASGCGPQYPHCERDDSCKTGEFCVMSQCQECRTANDCAAGQRCLEGRCE